VKQWYKGTSMFIELTEKGNFAVIEVKEENLTDKKVFDLPREILREADVIIKPSLVSAQENMSQRIFDMMPKTNKPQNKKIREK
jgi:hypothetical protein